MPRKLRQALEERRMESFINHVQSQKHTFHCSKAGSSDQSVTLAVSVKNKGNSNIDSNRLDLLSEKIDDSYADLIALYRHFDGVDLYIQDKIPAIIFYPIKYCKTKNKMMKTWFSSFDSVSVNRIKSKGIAFGEVVDSSNLLVFEDGKLKLMRWWDDDIELGDLNTFLRDLSVNPADMIKRLGSSVRFYDASDEQYVPRAYE